MDKQTVGDMIGHLTNLIKEGKATTETLLVSASDEEGNSYDYVYFTPTVGRFVNQEFNDKGRKGEKVVCIN